MGATGTGSVGGSGGGSSQGTQLRGLSISDAAEWVFALQAATAGVTGDAWSPSRVVVDTQQGEGSPIILGGSPGPGGARTPPAVAAAPDPLAQPLSQSLSQQSQSQSHQRQPSSRQTHGTAAAAGAIDAGAGSRPVLQRMVPYYRAPPPILPVTHCSGSSE